ncbi:hypothetical protein D3218_18620 [Aureimonas flava]|uniref:Uncharacterized protein n=1 Tax=Aureimonas flava TaxID=2320271 RepID=A0A3A1WFJ2_9HYPH|nr:hypothetical protein [Aureimonas flava]RIX97586.1 hypothetical protein D3218_18620 [Aureimonas flava]
MSAVRETTSFPEVETMAQTDPGRVAEVTSLFSAPETGEAEPIRSELAPAEPAVPAKAIALAVGQLTIEPSPTDWTRTLTLVERTAATIRAYEKRFVQLDKQSKALADRAAEDQHRLQTHIHSLEERLRQAEERVIAAETALRDAEYHEWEADMRSKRAEQRAGEAEAKCRQTEAYLRRVHELLAGVT